MVTPNNSILWNATAGGFVGGMLKGRRITKVNSGAPPAIGTPDPAYAIIANQAFNLAEEVDSLLPNDHVGSVNPAGTQAISVVSTGVAIIPSNGAITFAQIMKDVCLKGLVLGIVEGRGYGFPSILTPAELSAVAAAVQESYNLFAEVFVQPITVPANLNNQLIVYGAYCGALAGMMAGNPELAINGSVASNIANALLQLGYTVDAGIPFDATMTGVGVNGLPLAANATNLNIQNQLAKTLLIFSLAMAANYKRDVTSLLKQFQGADPTYAEWAAEVAPPIIAAYNAMLGSMQTTTEVPPNLNPVLWNEAFSGFVCGNLSGRPFKSTSNTDPNYLAVAAAASSFASQVDQTFTVADITGAPVPAGSVFTGVSSNEGQVEAVTPFTGQLIEAQLGKTDLLWAICRAVNFGRPLLGNAKDTTQSTYTGIANAVVALYMETVIVALNTP